MEVDKEVQKNPAGPALVIGVIAIIDAIFGSMLFGIIGAAVAAALGIFAIMRGLKSKQYTSGAQGSGGIITGVIALAIALMSAMSLHFFVTNVKTATDGKDTPVLQECTGSLYYGVTGMLRKISALDLPDDALQEEIDKEIEIVQNRMQLLPGTSFRITG